MAAEGTIAKFPPSGEELPPASSTELPNHFPDRIIFHVDMDSFYASCEISKKPELKDQPFVVGADPKEGKGRGVVIACNYAARKFGIRSATPISKAWELCPKAIFVRPNFAFYEEVSVRVMGLIREFSDLVEQVSIDEAYLEVTNRIRTLQEDSQLRELEAIRTLAAAIKKAVLDNEKITCSIGVANSKIIAKIATDMQKPDGLTIVQPEEAVGFLSPLPVGKIPGVGKVTERVLEADFKVKTIQELAGVPAVDLRTKLGRTADWLLSISRGEDRSQVIPHWDPVSISGETTFQEDVEDFHRVRDAMEEVAKEVHQRATSSHYRYKTVGIKIRFSGFETHTRARSLRVASDSLEVLQRECERLLSGYYGSGKKVRLIGVRVSALEKVAEDQLTLTDWER